MVNGYLELDGKIYKISSEDDLKDFVSRIGKEMEPLSEKQFEEMCVNKSKTVISDDCGIYYSEDGTRLLFGANNGSAIYKIKEGVLYVCDYAFDWKYDYDFIDGNGNCVPTFDRYNKNRTKIEKLFIPDSVLGIGHSAFSENWTIHEVNASDSIEYIGNLSFFRCSNLSAFNLPAHIKYIGNDAFSGCEKLSFDMRFPLSLKIIGARAFQGCKTLSKVILPESVKEIGSHAFKDCENLEEIYIPETIEKIGSGGIFEGCTKLTAIYIPLGSKNKFSVKLPFYSHLFVETNEI